MTITDNLAIRIKAESGQTVITDNIVSLALTTGAGTVSNIADGTYGNLWRINGGSSSSADISGLGLGNWSEGGLTKVTTVAIRFRAQTRQDAWLRYMITGSDSSNGLALNNSSASATSTINTSALASGTASAITALASYTAGTVVTMVMRYTVANGYNLANETWIGGLARTGATPNATANYSFTLNTKALAYLYFAGGTTETFDVLDYALWNRGLTDDEAAAVADDIRTVLYAAGNAAPTFPGPNIGNQTGTVGTALTSNTISDSFSDSDALTFTAVGSWPAGVTVSSAGVISGTPTTAGTYASLIVRATDTAAQTVDSDTFSFTISAEAANAQITATAADATFSGTAVGYVASSSAQVAATTADAAFSGAAFVASASGSFVTEPMVNNTGTIQASVAVLYEWRVGAGIGVAPTSVNYGTGTTDASGVLTATGLTAGTGVLLVATTDRASVYYQAGTVV